MKDKFENEMESEFGFEEEIKDSDLDILFEDEPVPETEIQRKNRSMINIFIRDFEIDLYDVTFSTEVLGDTAAMDFRKCYYMGEFIGYIRIANYPQKKTDKPVLGFTEVINESSIQGEIACDYSSDSTFPY